MIGKELDVKYALTLFLSQKTTDVLLFSKTAAKTHSAIVKFKCMYIML